MTRVLIAADGTDASVEVATVAQRLFGPTADYLILNVVATDPAWAGGIEPAMAYPVPYAYPASVDDALFRERDREAEADAAETVRHVADESGLPDAEPMVDTGAPTEAILRAADEQAVDVIVVGSSHSGWFSRLVHGSVSEGVVRGSDIPVLVAKGAS